MSQLQQIKKMGNIKDLLSMVPGVSKMMKDVEVDENAFKPIEAMINSMTPAERGNPDLINTSRKKRIVSGSGVTTQQMNAFLQQFDDMRKLMKNMNQFSQGKALQALKAMKR